MGKVKFQESWTKYRPWLKPNKQNIHGAICMICSTNLDISAGVCQVLNHESRKKHTENSRKMSGQTKFKFSSNGVSLTCPTTSTRILSTEDQVLAAEIFRCLNLIETNCPFSSVDSDNESYSKMFPDSAIAKSYSQKRGKVRYTIQFGIAPVVKHSNEAELKGNPFTFKFNETTTSQTKKQYDAYATFYSATYKQVVTLYLNTLFVGRCTADDLLNHFNTMIRNLGLETSLCLSLGMDGPNVNKKFARILNKELVKEGIYL